MTNKGLIRMHLEKHIHEEYTVKNYVPEWDELVSYCSGYYGNIFQEVIVDILMVIKELQREGKVK